MIVRAKITIKSGGENHAPGAVLELDEADGLSLIGLGFAERVDAFPVFEAVTDTSTVVLDAVLTPQPSAPDNTGLAEAADADAGGEASPDTDSEDPGAKRQADIRAAIELLSDADFVRTGPRTGKPKVAPVEAVLGFDVTAEEVDAAFALKEAGL